VRRSCLNTGWCRRFVIRATYEREVGVPSGPKLLRQKRGNPQALDDLVKSVLQITHIDEVGVGDAEVHAIDVEAKRRKTIEEIMRAR
jgi:hypothetical protein